MVEQAQQQGLKNLIKWVNANKQSLNVSKNRNDYIQTKKRKVWASILK